MARLVVFLMYMRLREAEALRKLRLRCASGILIVVFNVFDFLCQFQAFHVFFKCVFDYFDESDDEIS
ncbi:hypothetical protein Hanom_Chr02g00103541 [Helianthus anomalus]